MARYPTFDEYQRSGNYAEGLKRVDNFLKKDATSIELRILKLRFLAATNGDLEPVLDQLLTLEHVVKDPHDLTAIADAVAESQRNAWPRPNSVGPQVDSLWARALKTASVRQKLDLLSGRLSEALWNDRLSDAQAALIQLKVLQPKNRMFYFAHAALTQMLSTSKDDLQARLALGLARKAVKEGFDSDQGLDCRVSGQIFALHGADDDLDGITGKRFGDSKQVYDALRRLESQTRNGFVESGETIAVEPMQAEIKEQKRLFRELIASNAPAEDVVGFTANAIRLFHRATTTSTDDRRREKIDACFIALSGLIRAFELTTHDGYLLNAAHLATTLLQASPHTHEASLILVYLYMRLNLGSLALTLWDSLQIKEVQHDTVGHALFTRLSIIHPHTITITKKDNVEPLELASKALQVYTRCDDKLAGTEANLINHGQTGMLFDLHELRHRLRDSITRRFLHLEQRRLDRLLYGGQGEDFLELGPRVTANWTETVDNRDFAATFDYGCNVEKVLHGWQGGMPNKQLILNMLAADIAWCLACGKEAPINDVETLLNEVNPNMPEVESLKIDDRSSKPPGMMDVEVAVGRMSCMLIRVLLDLKSNHSQLATSLVILQSSISKIHLSSFLGTNGRLTDSLIDCYAWSDILRTTVRACDYARPQSGDQMEKVAAIKEQASKRFEELQWYARDRATKVRSDHVKARMAEDKQISNAVALFGADERSSFYAAVAASAREGWEGLRQIKMA